MKCNFLLGILCVSVAAMPIVAQESGNDSISTDQITRGSYLVNNIGLCNDCHSTRGQDGQFVPELLLKGAALMFAPTVEMPWAPVAPPLAGLPQNYTAEQFISFIMTGVKPDGQSRALPPMPEYKFSREDAEAVTAYLQSL